MTPRVASSSTKRCVHIASFVCNPADDADLALWPQLLAKASRSKYEYREELWSPKIAQDQGIGMVFSLLRERPDLIKFANGASH